MKCKIIHPVLGVPITFLDKYNPNQFEIVGISSKDYCGNVSRLKDAKYYHNFTRGKVVTKVDGYTPMVNTNSCGGTICKNEDGDVLYQLYHRVFIKRKDV